MQQNPGHAVVYLSSIKDIVQPKKTGGSRGIPINLRRFREQSPIFLGTHLKGYSSVLNLKKGGVFFNVEVATKNSDPHVAILPLPPP